MKFVELRARIVSSFAPIVLVCGEEAIDEALEQAIEWWDRVCAYTVLEEFSYNQTEALTLPDRVDQVVDVLPDRVTTELFTAQTLLLGVTILDYDIPTLAMKQDHLANLRTYLGSRFRWRWHKPYLYITGMTTSVNHFGVIYLPHYDATDRTQEITGKAAHWIIRYAIGLVKQREGRILRMGSVIQSPIDGAELVADGEKDLEKVEADWNKSRPPMVLTRTA